MRRAAVAMTLWAAFVTAALVAARMGTRIVIDGDGIGYFAPLASWLADHDLDLANEIQPHVPAALLQAIYLTPDGRLGNPFSIGPAMMWAPAVLLFDVQAAAPAGSSRGHPLYTPRAAQAIFWSSSLAVALGCAVLVAMLTSFVAPWVAAVSVAAALFGTPAIAYVLLDPSYSHAASFMAASLLVAAAWFDWNRRPLPLPLLGACAGLVTLMRWQDAVLGLVFVPRLLDVLRTAPRRRKAVWRMLGFAGPVALCVLPQLLYWYVLYGRIVIVPPGPELSLPRIPQLLFSTWNGAFVWSPILLLGLVAAVRNAPPGQRIVLGVVIALQIAISASVLDWWGGRSFGARRLVSLAPLAAVGLATVLERIRAPKRWFTIAAIAILLAGCAWNTTLIRYQRLAHLPWNPGNQADYVRHHAPSSPRARRYALWDYPRLVAEVAEARRLEAARDRRDRPAR